MIQVSLQRNKLKHHTVILTYTRTHIYTPHSLFAVNKKKMRKKYVLDNQINANEYITYWMFFFFYVLCLVLIFFYSPLWFTYLFYKIPTESAADEYTYHTYTSTALREIKGQNVVIILILCMRSIKIFT